MKQNMLKTIVAAATFGIMAQVPAFGVDKDQSEQKESSQQSASRKNLQTSKMKGNKVSSKSGESIGQVEDIIIDSDSGTVQFVIVSSTKAEEGKQAYTPVPWGAVEVDKDKNLTLNTDKEKFQSAPTVSKDRFADQSQEQVLAIYRFYEVTPPGTAIGGTGSSSQQSQGSGSSSDKESEK